MVPVDDLGPGEMGYITAAIKTVADCNVGDTITDDRSPAAEPLPGFKPSHPGGVVRPVSRSTPTISRSCATAWASCG